MTALSDLLNDAKGDRSIDALIAAAQKRKIEVKDSARAGIYKALKGDHGNPPREATLRLWAAIFSLDVGVVRDAAGAPRGELGPWQPVDEAAQLSQPIRDALDELIKTIVREGRGEGRVGPAATRPPAPRPGDQLGNVTNLSRAARKEKVQSPDPAGDLDDAGEENQDPGGP